MAKRFLCLLLLCVAAPFTAAWADAPELHYIDCGDGVNIVDLLPRADGGLLLCGYTYTKNAFQEGFVYEGEQRNIRTDAFAVALDANGREEWRLRMGDPEALNCFSAVAPIQDGEYLLTYQAAHGTLGVQHFIVNPNGVIEEMLPSRELREKGLHALRSVDGGFLGGGSESQDDIILEPMLKTTCLQGFDRNLDETWRLDDASLYACLYEAASAGEDGYALRGEYYSVSDSGYSVEGTTLLRLDPNGAILWQKKWRMERSDWNVWIAGVLLLPDGDLLACGMGNPGDPDAVLPGASLSKFDRDGNCLWTKGYDSHASLYMLSGIAPLGAGFAVTDGMAGNGVYYVDADGEVLGRYRPPVLDNVLIKIFPAADGGLYVLGSIATPTDEIDGDTPVNLAFYVKLSELDFAPVER